MLFSIIPPEDVWAGAQDGGPAAGATQWLPIGRGAIVYLRQDPRHGICIERLISMEPRDYLDPRWQPGAPWPHPTARRG